MSKKILIIILFLLVVLAVVFFWRGFLMPANEQAPVADSFPEEISGGDPENCSYIIGGREIVMRDGYAEEVAYEVWEVGLSEDLNYDNRKERIVTIRDSAGTGDTYYISLALEKGREYEGVNAILLGEKISAPTVEFRQGIIIASFEDNAGEEQEKYFAYEADGFKERDFTKDSLKLLAPSPASYVSSPLTISGQARGSWYFEGVFPVTLVNWDGLIIAEGQAQAQSDWMTEDFVPFSVTLNFTADTTVSDRGWLILKKDNPSGLPENDDYLEIPVFFE